MRTVTLSTAAALTLALFCTRSVASQAPSRFPQSGNGLWYNSTGTVWSRTWLPVGNGYLAAMLPGGTAQEITQLNIESLWSGGPFDDPSYNGGNKQQNEAGAMATAMEDMRRRIFSSPNGEIENISALTTEAGAYGSYSGAGYFLSTINITGPVTSYARWLDLDSAIHSTAWVHNAYQYTRETYCAHGTQACTQHLTSSAARLPDVTYAWSNHSASGLPLPTISCVSHDTLSVRGRPSDNGMRYELLLRVRATPPGAHIACGAAPVVSSAPPAPGDAARNATLVVRGAAAVWATWVGGTEYAPGAGDAAHAFTFRGADPHAALAGLLDSAAALAPAEARAAHVADVGAVLHAFRLDLGSIAEADYARPTDALVRAYTVDDGSPYLEWLTFNYGRYLLFSSARGALPANLQGKWAEGSSAPWSGDYHANINLQMNYWAAEITGLGGALTQSLWDYMEKTWAPRGEYTARVLYNISEGWVTHNEMNIFGHTGIKASDNSAMWSNYPEANVWMMMHVSDRLSFSPQNTKWWKEQGYPLLKGVAQFHLRKLIPDEKFNDGTLVVAPCNSPEQAPITLGCSHAQQLIWMLFNAVEKGFAASGDTDSAFLEAIREKRSQMDKGIHVGSWGQLQEWKVEKDSPTDTHRHLSHLIGLYPGYSISNYDPSLQVGNLTAEDVLSAAQVSLAARGNGTGPDADAGWEKIWRAACWAQLGNADTFYHELKYTLERDFGENLFSLYNPLDENPIFQIDANLGYPGAVMNALVQTLDSPNNDQPLRVVILPALPKAWSDGSITGARLRGGISLHLTWKSGKGVSATFTTDSDVPSRAVEVVTGGKVVAKFISKPDAAVTIPL